MWKVLKILRPNRLTTKNRLIILLLCIERLLNIYSHLLTHSLSHSACLANFFQFLSFHHPFLHAYWTMNGTERNGIFQTHCTIALLSISMVIRCCQIDAFAQVPQVKQKTTIFALSQQMFPLFLCKEFSIDAGVGKTERDKMSLNYGS